MISADILQSLDIQHLLAELPLPTRLLVILDLRQVRDILHQSRQRLQRHLLLFLIRVHLIRRITRNLFRLITAGRDGLLLPLLDIPLRVCPLGGRMQPLELPAQSPDVFLAADQILALGETQLS